MTIADYFVVNALLISSVTVSGETEIKLKQRAERYALGIG